MIAVIRRHKCNKQTLLLSHPHYLTLAFRELPLPPHAPYVTLPLSRLLRGTHSIQSYRDNFLIYSFKLLSVKDNSINNFFMKKVSNFTVFLAYYLLYTGFKIRGIYMLSRTYTQNCTNLYKCTHICHCKTNML